MAAPRLLATVPGAHADPLVDGLTKRPEVVLIEVSRATSEDIAGRVADLVTDHGEA